MLRSLKTLNCAGKLLYLERPVIMGILNLSPDSFYDGGRYNDIEAAVNQVSKMMDEGAGVIDIGGMSSRPGAEVIKPEAEIKRVIPVLKELVKSFPEAIFSVDTVHSLVADSAIVAGAGMINDISAWSIDKKLVDVVAESKIPYVLMHMRGTPANMQDDPIYGNVLTDVLEFFEKKLIQLQSKGIFDILIDPGFGFGKTIEQNYKLLANLSAFQVLGFPILAGVSRKSMIWKALNIKPDEALNGTAALHMVALEQGAKILRAHDVAATKEVVELYLQLKKAKGNKEPDF